MPCAAHYLGSRNKSGWSPEAGVPSQFPEKSALLTPLLSSTPATVHHNPVCSLYEVGPVSKLARFPWEEVLQELVEPRSRSYIAPGTEGVVIIDQQPKASTWGFQRPWSKRPIHNARDDKLTGPTWREPFQQRRCLIPMRLFNEWSGPKGRKIKHRIVVDPDHWFYAAGIWEETPDGHFYTMLTTSPSEQMAAIHNRMPVLLRAESMDTYLESPDGALSLLVPFSDRLQISE